MPSINYLSPVQAVGLVAKDGSVFNLDSWGSSYNTSDNRVPYLASLSVQVSLGQTATISAVLDVPYDEWIVLVEEKFQYFVAGVRLICQLGYAKDGFLTIPFSGVVVQAPKVSMSGDSVTMTIEARGNAFLSAKQSQSVAYDGETVFEAIKSLTDRGGLSLYYLTANGEERDLQNPLVPGLTEALTKPLIGLVMKGTPYLIVKDLIRVAAGLDFYSYSTKIVIFSQKVNSQRKKGFIFEFRGRTAPQEGYLPILDFDTEMTIPFYADAHGVLNQTTNVEDKTDKGSDKVYKLSLRKDLEKMVGIHRSSGPFELTPDGAQLEAIGNVTLTSLRKAESGLLGGQTLALDEEFGVPPLVRREVGQSGQLLCVDSDDPLQAAKVDFKKKAGEERSGIQASWSTMGMPAIVPGTVVAVTGVSRIFRGRYMVRTVDHIGDASGYITKIQAFTIGSGETISEIYQKFDVGFVESQALEPEGVDVNARAKVAKDFDAG